MCATICAVGLVGVVVGPQAAQAKSTTLTVLIWDQTNPDYRPVFAAYEKQHPGVKVKIVTAPYDRIDDKFVTMKAANVPVDVIFNQGVMGWVSYANNGLFTDLTPYIKRDTPKFPKDLLPIATTGLTFGGKVVGLNFNVMGATGVWYNERLVEEAGLAKFPNDWEDMSWTWDRYVESTRKLTKYGAGNAIKQVGTDFFVYDNLIQYSWSFGGDWYPKDAYTKGYAKKSTLNTTENIKTFNALRDLSQKYRVMPNYDTTGWTWDFSKGLYTGTHATWMDPIQIASLPAPGVKPKGKVAFAPLPVVPGVGRVRGFSWLEGMAMCQGTKHSEEAWTFMKWVMTEPSAQGFEWPGNGARRSAWEANQKKVGDVFDLAYSKPVIDGALDRMRPFPRQAILGSEQVFASFQPKIAAFIYQKKAASIESILASAAKEADSTLSRVSVRIGRSGK